MKSLLNKSDITGSQLLRTSRQHVSFTLTAIISVVLTSLIIIGCSRPQAAPQNRELISSLRTAVSARNSDWLERNATVIEQRRCEGKLADDEYEEFQTIIAQARAGQWKEAEQEAIAFQKSQQPSREEIQRVSEQRQRGE